MVIKEQRGYRRIIHGAKSLLSGGYLSGKMREIVESLHNP